MAMSDSHASKLYNPILSASPLTQPGRRYHPKTPISIITAILVVLGLQFIVLPRYVYQISPSSARPSQFHLDRLEAGLQKCTEFNTLPIRYPVTRAGSRTNPRWNPVTGENETVVLKNVTLFDREKVLDEKFDVMFKKGIVEFIKLTRKAVSKTKRKYLIYTILYIKGY